MNKNILKLLAALTMVIDHAGLLLFPQAAVLRWIGRISFPLFAFCVGDGCVHTRKPRVYFWRVLGLGLACQIVFAAEELLDGGTLRGSQALYLNILFTLALAILLCTSFLRLQRQPNAKNAAVCAAAMLAVAGADMLCQAITARTGVLVTFDYGAMGAFLPLFAMLSQEKHQQFVLFSLGMAIYCLTQCGVCPTCGGRCWRCPFCGAITASRAAGAGNGRSTCSIPPIWPCCISSVRSCKERIKKGLSH